MKLGSELMMPCPLMSCMDMRDLSDKILEICEEAFQNNLGSLLRNFVDKSEAEVRK
jgi:hypothetical protein